MWVITTKLRNNNYNVISFVITTEIKKCQVHSRTNLCEKHNYYSFRESVMIRAINNFHFFGRFENSQSFVISQ